jgi:hypothetical protein
MPMSGRWLSAALLIGCKPAGPANRPAHPPPDDPAETTTPPTSEELVEQLEASSSIPDLEREHVVAGIDVDQNGIRDDVDKYIYARYPKLIGPAQQLAKALQASVLVDLEDPVALGHVAMDIARAVDCVDRSVENIVNKPDDPDVIDALQAITANTKHRMRSYLAFNSALDGTLSFPYPLEGDVCDSPPEN